MADTFTVFAKFGDVCASLDEADRKELIYAINMYGMFGEEVELPYHLAPVFIALREDIDNSKSARRNGTRGGRPKSLSSRAEGDCTMVSEPSEPGVSESGKHGVSESPEPVVSGKAGKPESQTKSVQTKPKHTKPEGEGAKRGRFTPPTRDEARGFAEELGMPASEGDAFVDHFASNGWRVSGKAPMRDWRASMRNWRRNWERGSFAPRGEPPKSPPRRAMNAIDPIAEADRLDREYRERFGGGE